MKLHIRMSSVSFFFFYFGATVGCCISHYHLLVQSDERKQEQREECWIIMGWQQFNWLVIWWLRCWSEFRLITYHLLHTIPHDSGTVYHSVLRCLVLLEWGQTKTHLVKCVFRNCLSFTISSSCVVYLLLGCHMLIMTNGWVVNIRITPSLWVLWVNWKFDINLIMYYIMLNVLLV